MGWQLRLEPSWSPLRMALPQLCEQSAKSQEGDHAEPRQSRLKRAGPRDSGDTGHSAKL